MPVLTAAQRQLQDWDGEQYGSHVEAVRAGKPEQAIQQPVDYLLVEEAAHRKAVADLAGDSGQLLCGNRMFESAEWVAGHRSRFFLYDPEQYQP
jgi:erythromycin esterase-like protein